MYRSDSSTIYYNNGAKVTRHIYAGTARVISSVGDARSATSAVEAGNSRRNAARLAESEDSMASLYHRHNIPFARPDLAARAGSLRSSTMIASPESYFYHSDHLGNTSFMTDRSGSITQQSS